VSKKAQEELKKLVKENSEALIEQGVSKVQDFVLPAVPTTQQEVVEMLLRVKNKMEKNPENGDTKSDKEEDQPVYRNRGTEDADGGRDKQNKRIDPSAKLQIPGGS
jgi:hypothetical protein